jgi:methyl-accepting chemotaxis protein PixJ
MLLESKPVAKALPPAPNATPTTVAPQNQQPNSSPLTRAWQNLSFQPKLIIVVLLLTGIPIVVVTQLLVRLTADFSFNTAKVAVREKGSFFNDEYVLWTVEESKSDANGIAKTVQQLGIELDNPKVLASKLPLLQAQLQLSSEGVEPESIKSFKIVVNNQSRTIAQNVQIADPEPSLSLPTTEAKPQTYRVTSLPSGNDLSSLPIVKNAIASGKPLFGVELLKINQLRVLGIAQKTNIGLRAQLSQGLAEQKLPVAENTYDLEGGKSGLVSMAVYPILVGGRVAGASVVGVVLNRHYSLVDKFSTKYIIPISTIFAKDLRVATNVPYIDPTSKTPNGTRATGTRASREVTQKVLEQGQDYVGDANIAGVNYLTFYRPIFDHQKLLNPQSKPIGMVSVGRAVSEIEAVLRGLENSAYTIGFISLLIAAAIATIVAASFAQPIRKLASFTQRLGKGELEQRLEQDKDRQDEIGVLSLELNRMAANLEQGTNEKQKEAERAQLYAQIASAAIEEEQDLVKLLDLSVSRVREYLKCDRVVVYRFREDGSGYIAAESVIEGLPKAIEDKVNDACIPQNLLSAYREGRVVATEDLTLRNYHPDHVDLLRRLQIKSNLVVPALQRGNLFGLLIAHYCFSTHQWQEQEIQFMQQAANQIGVGLDRASFLAEVERSRQQAESVGEQQKQEKESLQKSALELLMQVDPVSRGDLTVRANVTEDEMGTIADSYNALIRSLRKIVSEVQSASLEVTANTQENEKTVKVVANEALQQSESIKEALAQIQVMAQSIMGVGARAQQAEVQMSKANQVVKAGDAAMNKTVAGISAIRETVTEATEKVKRLDEASQKISKVVKLISGFAAQTNLLALNASIEAARAGEDGEGFGVVANEVRALAQRSAAATNEIRVLIEEIQTQTASVVKAMDSGSEQVLVGTRLVEDSRQQLNQISLVNSQVNQLVQEIAKAAVVQSQASNSVGEKIQSVSAIATDTSRQTEQVVNSLGELLAVAEKLQISVSQFKV